MNNLNLSYISKAIGDLSGIPVRLFDGDELVYSYSVIHLPRDPMTLYQSEIGRLAEHVGYFVTPRFLCYGIVNAGTNKLVIGPTAQVLPGDPALRELAFQLDVPREEMSAFVDGLKAITRMPLESLLQMLCVVNHILNGEELELSDIAIRESEQLRIKENVEKRRTAKTYDAEPEPSHNTLQIEEAMTEIVSRGDTTALRQWIAQAPAVRGGVLASDQLRQLKNTFIVTATLVSRAAIRGGVNAEAALSLSDAYIQQAELLTDQAGITNLQYNMVLEFTEQVERVHWGAQPSKLAIEAANYVQRHLTEPIRTEDMARAFFLSRTHFSARFKKETGQTLTEFVLREKTEEAKRLLRYSD